MKVVLGGRAGAQIDRRRSWWRANRSERDLFDQEYDEAIDELEKSAATLPIVRHVRGHPIRRWLMPSVGCHLYFRIDGDVVTILAAWGAVRGRQPKL